MATSLPPLAYPGSIFSEDDMNRAVAALDLVMQDFLWQPGENRVREDSLARSLAAKGITLGLARELMRRLADMGIFTPWSHTKPAGRRWENGFPVILIGDETTHCRVTTKERWHSFLLQHRSSRQNASADVPTAEPETKDATATPVDRESLAIALLFKHPNWGFPQIAEAVGASPKTLYKWKKFREAAKKAGKIKGRGSKDRIIPRGSKRDGVVEAYERDSSDE